MGHGRNQVAPVGLIDSGPVDMLSACKKATFVARDIVFAQKPQVLRLCLTPKTRQTPLRMTALAGISTEPSIVEM